MPTQVEKSSEVAADHFPEDSNEQKAVDDAIEDREQEEIVEWHGQNEQKELKRMLPLQTFFQLKAGKDMPQDQQSKRIISH